ncbi:hypothetical protein BXZ70DRAFT_355300 [Cristinia sonorae]|uniref:Uncharacterized protein n=1 Tax=Cristinia sonorae TaxID=1940300 RepID=A0A8K0XN33_9AGAR|nr:hypothetical protein BXZ70DRAFT_355300 [Cristinia sonorae]
MTRSRDWTRSKRIEEKTEKSVATSGCVHSVRFGLSASRDGSSWFPIKHPLLTRSLSSFLPSLPPLPRSPSLLSNLLSFIYITIPYIMKFNRSSIIFAATLASSSSFQALAAPTDSRDQQQGSVARSLPDTSALTSAAGPGFSALGALPIPGGLPGLPGAGPKPSQPPPPPSSEPQEQHMQARQLDGVVMTLEGLLNSLGLGGLLNPVVDVVGGLLGVHGQSKAAAASTPLNASQIDQVRAVATNLAKNLSLPIPGGSGGSGSPLSSLPVLGGLAGHAGLALDVIPSDDNSTTTAPDNSTTPNSSTAPDNSTIPSNTSDPNVTTTPAPIADESAILDAASLAALAELAALPVPLPTGVLPGLPVALPPVNIPSNPLTPLLPVPPPNTPAPAGSSSGNASAAGLPLPVALPVSPPAGLPVPIPGVPVPLPDAPVPLPVHPGAPSPPGGAPTPPGPPAPPSGPAPPSPPAPPSGAAPSPPGGAPPA